MKSVYEVKNEIDAIDDILVSMDNKNVPKLRNPDQVNGEDQHLVQSPFFNPNGYDRTMRPIMEPIAEAE